MSSGEVFVFGGYDGRTYLNDLHVWRPLDPQTNKTGDWAKLDHKGTIPEIR